VILWRAGLRVQEALALAEADRDRSASRRSTCKASTTPKTSKRSALAEADDPVQHIPTALTTGRGDIAPCALRCRRSSYRHRTMRAAMSLRNRRDWG
jgi:hypothetical protein